MIGERKWENSFSKIALVRENLTVVFETSDPGFIRKKTIETSHAGVFRFMVQNWAYKII